MYCKNLQIGTPKIITKFPENEISWFENTIIHPEDADLMANSADLNRLLLLEQLELVCNFMQTSLSRYLGILRYLKKITA